MITAVIITFILFGVLVLPISILLRGRLGFIVGLIITLLFTIMFCGQEYYNQQVYNNGICKECGGQYHFQCATKYRTGTTKYYVCDNCENIITIE